jgi:hypothetical protein
MDFLHEFYDAAVVKSSGHVQVTFVAPSIKPKTCGRTVLLGDRKLENFDGGSRATRRAIHDGEILSEVPVRERYPGPSSWGLGVGSIFYVSWSVHLHIFQ